MIRVPQPQQAGANAPKAHAANAPKPSAPPQPQKSDVLPFVARGKLVRIEGEANDARHAAASAIRRMAELQQGRNYWQDQTPPNEEALGIELKRLSRVRMLQNERHRVLAGLVANLQAWVLALPRGVVLEPARLPPTELEKDVALSAAIEHVRASIAATRSGLLAVRNAPPPLDELKSHAKQYVHGLAQRGRPRVAADGEGLRIRFDDPTAFAASTKSALPLLAWLHQDAMIAALEREVDRLVPHSHALTAEQKDRQVAELRTQLESLERREEQLVTWAQEQGLDVLRRVDASPLAVLGIAIAGPGKA
jgi:hypothetical protein